MGFFRRMFVGKPTKPPLSPLEDPTLGRLVWDEDSEGWVGTISLRDSVFRLYIGGGSEQEYPAEALLDLLRQPYKNFDSLSAAACAYLRSNMDSKTWKVNPDDVKLEGLETYQHYLSDRTYTVTFSDPSEAIWKVSFRDGKPLECGVDD